MLKNMFAVTKLFMALAMHMKVTGLAGLVRRCIEMGLWAHRVDVHSR